MKLSPDRPPEGTVRDWLEHRAADGGIAVVFPETQDRLAWTELRDAARAFARDLTARGAAKGESIAIVSPNGREVLIALYGALVGGFRSTMINLAAGRDAIAYALSHSEARFAFVHDDARALFDAANESGVSALALGAEAQADLYDVSPEDDALLMYTSGTTGRPKGVVHAHSSLLAGGWTTAIAHALRPEDRGFCILPIYHINGLCVTVMGALVSGGSLTMTSRFSASRFWEQAGENGATWFSAVPTIISHLLHGKGEPDAACRARLRFGRSASSALAVETQQAFEARFDVPLVETMGLTETAAQILSNPLPPGPRKIGSPGIAYGCEVEIQDTKGASLPPEVEGEIVVRGPNVMRGYLKNPEATEATFRDGWLRTGDLARMDAEGYVFVTGRLKELIIKGGENIAPREVDEALYAHPDVVEAAAFPRKCARYGEAVEAAVRVRDGSSLDDTTLIELCRSKLGDFKTPDAIHFLPELPKGPSGKIQRLKIADLVPEAPS
ncbi:AMP-binding protein [Jannaschia seohaensis]|uniref:Acyl-CoA synthetase (AMP-forming)/AMP-acid ligase II n=1 Tax=Jannaschia seohaensis TaxID=475081 RepID=A0A2Y9B1X8_9RHOB|nr:AMP-binding protein [Jannaschia seohaensis]PWJ15806.1 acyl-CoA synthetase (AMP-forming)/AMP-acid ligase II [Jannaschia seohaensis]SSA49498.1 Acyl-CoA synthetase (AMP-forming)/AMP-acid ligase II [Jannaschia seohaensis]